MVKRKTGTECPAAWKEKCHKNQNTPSNPEGVNFVQGAKRCKKTEVKTPELWKLFIDKNCTA